MARKPFPIRLDTTAIEKIDALSKILGIPKSQIVDEALDLHLDKLANYAAMDSGPPKTAAAVKRQVVALKAQPVAGHTVSVNLKRVRGWDAEGRPVY